MLGPEGGRGKSRDQSHILLLLLGRGSQGEMSEVKLQPGPGVTRAGGVDSVDTGTVCSLCGSDLLII